MEGIVSDSKQVMESLEEALKDVTDPKEPLHERLGPALAALLLTAQTGDLGIGLQIFHKSVTGN